VAWLAFLSGGGVIIPQVVKDPEEQPQKAMEVDVERLPENYDPAHEPGDGDPSAPSKVREISESIGPMLAGMLIDVIDAATFNPIMGMLVGWPLGYYIVRQVGCSKATASKLGILSGVYCALPGTFLIPMATILAIYGKVRAIMSAPPQ
jgi:hypothetical protein